MLQLHEPSRERYLYLGWPRSLFPGSDYGSARELRVAPLRIVPETRAGDMSSSLVLYKGSRGAFARVSWFCCSGSERRTAVSRVRLPRAVVRTLLLPPLTGSSRRLQRITR